MISCGRLLHSPLAVAAAKVHLSSLHGKQNVVYCPKPIVLRVALQICPLILIQMAVGITTISFFDAGQKS